MNRNGTISGGDEDRDAANGIGHGHSAATAAETKRIPSTAAVIAA